MLIDKSNLIKEKGKLILDYVKDTGLQLNDVK